MRSLVNLLIGPSCGDYLRPGRGGRREAQQKPCQSQSLLVLLRGQEEVLCLPTAGPYLAGLTSSLKLSISCLGQLRIRHPHGI